MTASRAGHAEAASLDLATLLGVTALAFVLANVVHEGAGHGGACVIAGGRAVTWNAIYFECDSGEMSAAGTRWLAAAGTLANLALSALAFLVLALTPRRASIGRYFLWLVGTLDLMQATGDADPVADAGDAGEEPRARARRSSPSPRKELRVGPHLLCGSRWQRGRCDALRLGRRVIAGGHVGQAATGLRARRPSGDAHPSRSLAAQPSVRQATLAAAWPVAPP